MAIKKIGISVREDTYLAAKKAVESGKYRNVSHVFESAARKMLEDLIAEGTEDPRQAPAQVC